jgi:hypothetical protein
MTIINADKPDKMSSLHFISAEGTPLAQLPLTRIIHQVPKRRDGCVQDEGKIAGKVLVYLEHVIFPLTQYHGQISQILGGPQISILPVKSWPKMVKY